MRVYRPMRWKARREVATPRLVLIVSMSPPGYSSARLRPRRAGLRFTRRFQLTNGLDPNQVPLGSRHKISSTPLLRDARRNWRRRGFYYATRGEIGEGADSTTRREEKSAKAAILLRDAKRNRRRRRVYYATRREIGDAMIFSSVSTTDRKNSSSGFYSRAIYTLWGALC